MPSSLSSSSSRSSQRTSQAEKRQQTVALPEGSVRVKRNPFTSLRIGILDGDLNLEQGYFGSQSLARVCLELGSTKLITGATKVENGYLRFKHLAKFRYYQEDHLSIKIQSQQREIAFGKVDLTPANSEHSILCTYVPLYLNREQIGKIFLRLEFGLDEPDIVMEKLHGTRAEYRDKSPVRRIECRSPMGYSSPSPAQTASHLARLGSEDVLRFMGDFPFRSIRLELTIGAQWPGSSSLYFKGVLGTTSFWTKSAMSDASGDCYVAQQFVFPFNCERQLFLFAAKREDNKKKVIGGTSCDLLQLLQNGVAACRMRVPLCDERALPVGFIEMRAEMCTEAEPPGCFAARSIYPQSPMVGEMEEANGPVVAPSFSADRNILNGSGVPASPKRSTTNTAVVTTVMDKENWRSDFKSLNVVVLGCTHLFRLISECRVGFATGHNLASTPFVSSANCMGGRLTFLYLITVRYGNEKLARVSMDGYTAEGDLIRGDAVIELQDVLLRRQIMRDVTLLAENGGRVCRLRLALECSKAEVIATEPVKVPLTAVPRLASSSLGLLRLVEDESEGTFSTEGLWRSLSDGSYGNHQRQTKTNFSPAKGPGRLLGQLMTPCFCATQSARGQGSRIITPEETRERVTIQNDATTLAFLNSCPGFVNTIPEQMTVLTPDVLAQIPRNAKQIELIVSSVRNVMDKHGVGTLNYQALVRYGDLTLVSPVSPPAGVNDHLGFTFTTPIRNWRNIFLEIYDGTVTRKVQFIGRACVDLYDLIRSNDHINPIVQLRDDSGRLSGIVFLVAQFGEPLNNDPILSKVSGPSRMPQASRRNSDPTLLREALPNTVHLGLGSCVGLPNPYGFPYDAYCVLRAKNFALETAPAERCNSSALFNQRAEFPAIRNETIGIEVYGKHEFGGDTLLAKGAIDLGLLEDGTEHKLAIPLVGQKMGTLMNCSIMVDEQPTNLAVVSPRHGDAIVAW